MRPLPIICLILSAAGSALAANPSTALAVLKLLPPGDLKNLARIEARDGTPAPERWHILVHDHAAENDLREYVIAAGEIVASRNLSQFAEALAPDEMLDASNLKFDSDRAAELLQEYALANGARISVLNYTLKSESRGAKPMWYVRGLDETGKELGSLVVGASKGAIISHDGFAAEPTRALTKKEPPKPPTRTTIVLPVDLPPPPPPPSEPEPAVEPKVRRPARGDEGRGPNVVERVGGTLRHFIFGR